MLENALPKHLDHHAYAVTKDPNLIIDQQYADDTGWASASKHKINNIKKTVPAKLKQRNLNVNESKTEEFTIKRNGDESWKSCKYLGTMLDTGQDISRRKGLSMAAYNNKKKILENKNITL